MTVGDALEHRYSLNPVHNRFAELTPGAYQCLECAGPFYQGVRAWLVWLTWEVAPPWENPAVAE